MPTGFKDLDTYLSGLQPSDFVLVAARPSMGKTAFVLNVAENVAIKQGITTAVFSLEMSNVQLVNRMLSLESTVDADKSVKAVWIPMTGVSSLKAPTALQIAADY